MAANLRAAEEEEEVTPLAAPRTGRYSAGGTATHGYSPFCLPASAERYDALSPRRLDGGTLAEVSQEEVWPGATQLPSEMASDVCAQERARASKARART